MKLSRKDNKKPWKDSNKQRNSEEYEGVLIYRVLFSRARTLWIDVRRLQTLHCALVNTLYSDLCVYTVLAFHLKLKYSKHFISTFSQWSVILIGKFSSIIYTVYPLGPVSHQQLITIFSWVREKTTIKKMCEL